jgi:phosphatidylinositol kinase/protein kinase (PI-3  family)
VLDAIILSLDPISENYKCLYHIIDRLLIMGVGDDCKPLRIQIFNSLSPSLDHVVSLADNVHCVIEALNDESLEVRMAAMTVISRLAHYDALRIMPIVRLTMKRLIYLLLNTTDRETKRDSVQLLQALVRGSDILIIPYVKQVALCFHHIPSHHCNPISFM